jgi:hypothetical protein
MWSPQIRTKRIDSDYFAKERGAARLVLKQDKIYFNAEITYKTDSARTWRYT